MSSWPQWHTVRGHGLVPELRDLRGPGDASEPLSHHADDAADPRAASAAPRAAPGQPVTLVGMALRPDAANTLPMRPRLSLRTLARLPAGVQPPGFDVPALRHGIVHLGCGAFHRAHQAVMTQRAIVAEQAHSRGAPPAWGITAASLRTPATVQALRPQDGLYSVLSQSPEGSTVEVVGAVRALLAPDATARAIACIGDASTRLVTLTITAAGYCIDGMTGRLDAAHPDIAADLQATAMAPAATPRPRSAIGLLVRGLALRRAAGAAPPAVLSCDNLQHNGRALRQACVDFAALYDDTLASWIAAHVQFPNTMVDRIVPATTAADRAAAAAVLGLTDAAPVVAEPFGQWVIEHFDGPRPRWEAAGAEFVADVAPWEASKLRLLNGGHLAVAYLGLLAGHATVADACADRDMADFVLRLMLDEQWPTLPPSDHDIRAYAHQLLARWRNPRIEHRLERIGRDGSAKLPARLLAPLRDNLAAGRPAPCTLLAVAAWMRCAAGHDGHGRPIDLQDPLSAQMRRAAREAGNEPEHLVTTFLELADVFGHDLPRDGAVRAGLVRAATALQRQGAAGAIRACLAGASH